MVVVNVSVSAFVGGTRSPGLAGVLADVPDAPDGVAGPPHL